MGNESKAWMLGPKGENAQVFEEMFLEAFRDYCYWRKNFHPEDEPYVSHKDRLKYGYSEVIEKMHGNLFHMLSHLKRSIPFFSPRYVGHMNTDLLMGGLLGYFAGMLYNQNNIVSEAATITLQFETEAMQWIAKMLNLPEKRAWGHLCSGGTSANIEGLWVARNLMMLPYQMALASNDVKTDIIKDFKVGDKDKSFGDFYDNKKLDSLSLEDLLSLRKQLINDCNRDKGFAEIVEKLSPGYLGFPKFFRICRDKLKDMFPKSFRVILSQNAHYSLRKSVGILGFGEEMLRLIPLDKNMRIDVKMLRKEIEKCHENSESVLAVVGVFGSTEEGSIDDFSGIANYRKSLMEEEGGYFWLHADACYGGYAASVTQPAKSRETILEILDLLEKAFKDLKLPSLDKSLIWKEEKWMEWASQAYSLGECDSVSIDPHKLGYIPYPAGAIFFRDFRVREVIRCDAPYINTSSADVEAGAWEAPFLGRYTLEGSRPGAYSAAVWLAHKTVPLNIKGHGRIVAESMLGARLLQNTLEKELKLKKNEDGVGCRFICETPDTNIVCYTFPCRYKGKTVPLAVMNKAVVQLYNELLPTETNPTQQCKFVIAKTDLSFDEYGDVLFDFVERLGLPIEQLQSEDKVGTIEFNPWRDDTKITLVRTVVMGPFLIQAMTRPKFREEKRHLLLQYADFLRDNVFRIVKDILNSPLLEDKESTHARPFIKQGIKVLILEDNLETAQDLKDKLWRSFNFENPQQDIAMIANLEDTLKFVKEHEIAAAIVDIDLPGKPRGGLEFLQEMSGKGFFKGGAVFTARETFEEEFKRISDENPDWLLMFNVKPSRREGRFNEVANKLMEDIWDILRR